MLIRLLGLTLIITSVACTKTEEKQIPYNDISFYTDVKDSQFNNTSMADAVVLISSGGGRGTGSFISSTGTLITNNHVLGSSNCLQEGCFISISQHYEKGKESKISQVFAKPLHIDKISDISIYQIYTTTEEDKITVKTQTKFQSPSYLKMGHDSPASLIDQKVFTIGHPLSTLKKVTALNIIGANQQNLTIGGAVISGQSGSPVLNANGELIGLVKTSTVKFTELSNNGINTTGGVVYIGEASKLFQQSAGQVSLKSNVKGNLDELYSLEDEELSDNWFKYIHLFLSLKSLPKTLANLEGEKSIINQLSERCEKYLEEYSDSFLSAIESTTDYSSRDCSNIKHFINCDDDDDDRKTWKFTSCPSDEERKKFSNYNLKLFDIQLKTQGSFHTSYLRAAADFDTELEYEALFTKMINKHQPILTYSLAYSMLKVRIKSNESMTYQGKDLINMFTKYKSNPNYKYSIYSVLWGLVVIHNNDIQYTDFNNLVNTLLADPEISLADKFLLDEFKYEHL